MAFDRTTFIGGRMKHYNNSYDYVEVTQEPSHKEVFINDQSRIYLVDIPPGEKTLFHRHSVDTVYIVLSEGWIKTEDADKDDKYPIVFSGDVTIIDKCKMAWNRLIKKEVYLSKGLTFILKHKEYPTVHRALASDNNTMNIVMLGIELS